MSVTPATKQRLAQKSLLIALAVALAILIIGSRFRGLANNRVSVAGRISFRGEPLAKGIIRFLPQESGLEPGGAIISGGEYQISSESGLMPGLYAITVTAPTPPPALGSESQGQLMQITELIPSDYNRQTTLFRSVQRGRSNDLNFDLSPPFATD